MIQNKQPEHPQVMVLLTVPSQREAQQHPWMEGECIQSTQTDYLMSESGTFQFNWKPLS